MIQKIQGFKHLKTILPSRIEIYAKSNCKSNVIFVSGKTLRGKVFYKKYSPKIRISDEYYYLKC